MATKLNQELLDQALTVSGHHSMDMGVYTREMVGKLNGDQRRVLGLLEAIDFGCWEASPRCITLGTNTEDDVQQYHVEHTHLVNS